MCRRVHNPAICDTPPGASHEAKGANDIGIIPTAAEGWADLERQLQLGSIGPGMQFCVNCA